MVILKQVWRLTAALTLCSISFVIIGCAKHSPSLTVDKDCAPKCIPKNLDRIPDPIPRVEPLSKYGNRFKNSNSYVALKRRYSVMPTSKGYRAQGQASWYGTKFHGKRTSSGEPYDMFTMTAAHRTLPLPTYARVTNMDNGKSVIVKVNDRGPFHNNRLIDLSYVAAHKLGILGKGTGRVTVESVDPRDHHGKIPGQKRGLFARNHKNSESLMNPKDYQKEKISQQLLSQTAATTTHASSKGNAYTQRISSCDEAPTKASSGAYDLICEQRAESATKSQLERRRVYPKLYLQVGAFTQKSHAETLLNEVSKFSDYSASIATQKQNKKSLYKVRLGPFDNQKQLQRATKALANANLPCPVTVKE